VNNLSTTETPATAPEAVELEIQRFLESRTNTTVPSDQDLFQSGLVSSMFAMELVVFLEQTYAVAIVGPDLKLDNFRTVDSMSSLVQRLLDE
jgi:methoxymalonate biosynthesis acyl carrier protein